MFSAPQGINFSSNVLSAPELARALCRVVSFIQDMEPEAAQLQRYEDWWEHDGLHFHKGAISIHELFEIVKSPQSLLESMQGDDWVFVGIAPDSQSWYLRFYIAWGDEGFELNGRFDITLSPALVTKFERQGLDYLDMKRQDAAAYYRGIRL